MAINRSRFIGSWHLWQKQYLPFSKLLESQFYETELFAGPRHPSLSQTFIQ